MMLTWTRKDRRVRDDAHCLVCGDYYGICKGEARAHRPATCKACGTPQCWTHGLARGTCGVCYVGLLDGIAGHNRPCGYKGCGSEAGALAPRVKRVCEYHLMRAGLVEPIRKQFAVRAMYWQTVDANPTLYPVL